MKHAELTPLERMISMLQEQMETANRNLADLDRKVSALNVDLEHDRVNDVIQGLFTASLGLWLAALAVFVTYAITKRTKIDTWPRRLGLAVLVLVPSLVIGFLSALPVEGTGGGMISLGCLAAGGVALIITIRLAIDAAPAPAAIIFAPLIINPAPAPPPVAPGPSPRRTRTLGPITISW